MAIELFEVGGCVRDEVMGITPHDIDFAVAGASGMAEVRAWLTARRFEIFVETPETMTIRARFPRTDPKFGKVTADFALCRKDGPSSDNRHPDFVESATLLEDLARRDFTVNAMAKDHDGSLIDPHNGMHDIATRTLRTVRDPMDRFREDALRIVRALRFRICKGFLFHESLSAALRDPECVDLIGTLPTERIRDELTRCFDHNTIRTLDTLQTIPEDLRNALLLNLKLEPTQRRRLRSHEDA